MNRTIVFFLLLLALCALLCSCGKSSAPAGIEVIKEVMDPAAEPDPLPENAPTDLPKEGAVYLGTSAFRAKIEELKAEFCDQTYWNHNGGAENPLGTTHIPCNHTLYGIGGCNRYESVSTRTLGSGYGMQCAGFAGLLSDRVFGTDAPARLFFDYDDLRPGDQARIDNDTHSVFLLEKHEDFCVVAECNAELNNCRIDWGRKIPREKMRGVYITRDAVV